MTKLKFEFTQKEINYIASVIATRPLAECRGIIENIEAQAAPQDVTELEVVEE